MSTTAERLIWGQDDGCETAIGRTGRRVRPRVPLAKRWA
jgi:hypothetical protein